LQEHYGYVLLLYLLFAGAKLLVIPHVII
jgi:hypothetical protein